MNPAFDEEVKRLESGDPNAFGVRSYEFMRELAPGIAITLPEHPEEIFREMNIEAERREQVRL